MGSINERRLDPRVRVQVRVEIEDEAAGRWRVFQTTNVSLHGARCAGPGMLGPGLEMEGRLFLPITEGGRNREVRIPFRARMAYGEAFLDGLGQISKYEFGLAFTALAESDREDLRSFLYDSMVADSPSHGLDEEEF